MKKERKISKAKNQRINKTRWVEKKTQLEDQRIREILFRLTDAKLELEALGYKLVGSNISSRFTRQAEIENIYTGEKVLYGF